MVKTSRKHYNRGSRSPTCFSNQQMMRSPFSSEIHKTKRSGKKLRKYRPFPPKSQHVLDLERQLALMQERLREVERRVKRQETESPDSRAERRSRSDFNDIDSRERRFSEEDPSRASTSKRSNGKRKRRTAQEDDDHGEDRRAHKVAFIHVGAGGERDLEDHLRGSRRINLQIVSSERLPDIDASDVIGGLDSSGTSRDYVDESHRCNAACPIDCQGHLRPNEIVIYESTRFNGRLFERKRLKGRFVHDAPRDDLVPLDMTGFRWIGGRTRDSGRRHRDHSRREPVSPRHERARQHHVHHDRRYHERFHLERLNDRIRRGDHRRQREVRSEVPPRLRHSLTPPPQEKGGSSVRSSPMPQKLAILLDSPPVPTTSALEHSWSTVDKSFNIVLREDDPMVMRRHPIAQSTDCVRGKQGYTSGLHMWEVSWPTRQRGTHAVIGVATRDAPLHAVGYQSLVGNSEQSWGWDLGRLKVFHNNVQVGEHYPACQWAVPDTFTMVLDMERGILGYAVQDQWLGWAVTGLKSSTPLYPIASTVWGHCEIKLRYIHGLESGVLSLQELIRNVVRKSIKGASKSVSKNTDELDTKIDSLPLPGALKKFVRYC